MCEPATITALATTAVSAATAAAPYIATASAIAGYVQTSQSAHAQEDAIRQGYQTQMEQTQLQQTQQNQQATDKMSERALEAHREMSRLSVIAGESGTMGGTNDRVIRESAFNAGQDMATIEANRAAGIKQTQTEAEGLRARATSNLNSIKQPSLIGTGLQIAGAFADAGARTQSNRVPTAK